MSKDVDSCLFCRIVAGAEAAIHVHEDALCTAFMDIHPLGTGHVLVIPKSHAQKLEELDEPIRHHLFGVCNRIVAAQRRAGFGVNGTHFLLNDGKAANQHVPHVHFHLIPRDGRDNGRFFVRMVLHITGLFGMRTAIPTLQAQAEAIRAQLQPLAVEAGDVATVKPVYCRAQ
ncbi:MAG TPA: HIT family protein [Noviherbaspirillum sp.]|nr:HIT family protein [Noviherbaspirillum sp.]